MDNNYNQNGNYGGYGSNNDNTYMPPNTNQSTNMGQNSPYMQPNPGQAMPYMQPNPGQGMPYIQPQAPKKGCAFGIAALVVGILSMTLCCVGGSVMGIAGIILGVVALCRKESKFGLAIGGIVTSVFGVLIGIYMLAVVIFAGAAYDEIKDMDEKEIENWFQERLDALENEGVSGLNDLRPEVNIVTNENPFMGHNFQCEDESVIYFNEDGTFLWYRDDSDHSDNYYTGTYEVYMGAEARSYITEDLAEYASFLLND